MPDPLHRRQSTLLGANARIAFGKRLRTLRRERDLSQEEQGFRADLDRNYVGGVERGAPILLATGFVVRGDRKRPSVECCYFDPTGLPFTAAKVAIKVTATRQAYVTTFHRLTLPEIRRIYRRAFRRGALVRDLKKELAQLLAAPVT